MHESDAYLLGLILHSGMDWRAWTADYATAPSLRVVERVAFPACPIFVGVSTGRERLRVREKIKKKVDAKTIRIANVVRSQRRLSVLTGDSLDQHRRTTHQSSLPVHCGGSQPQSDNPGLRRETWERILLTSDDLGVCWD